MSMHLERAVATLAFIGLVGLASSEAVATTEVSLALSYRSVLEQSARAGARSASMTALRLPGSVEPVFLSRLREAMPIRADRVIQRLRDIRGGRMDDSAFGARMRGRGTYWESIVSLFKISRRRYGLDRPAFVGAVPSRVCKTSRNPRRGQLTFEFETQGTR